MQAVLDAVLAFAGGVLADLTVLADDVAMLAPWLTGDAQATEANEGQCE